MLSTRRGGWSAIWRGFSVCLVLVMFSAARAHELRPAYLELRQTAAEIYEVLWKVPATGDNRRLALDVELPSACVDLVAARGEMIEGAYVDRRTVRCAGGLAERVVRIAGLEATMTDVLVRVEGLEGATQVARLTPSATSFVVEAAPRPLEIVRAYLLLGVEHILTGIDHLLFVLALILVAGVGWTLVKTVTAFTVSHTVTLTAATLGWVHVPQKPVEAVIALSIVFVAAEIVRGRRGRAGVTARRPWVVAFTFGLLHGLGFAGGLSEAGLPAGHIPLALLFFSLGVETGHFLFVGTVVTLAALARRARLPLPDWAPLAPAYAIGSVAMFWVIERIAAF